MTDLIHVGSEHDLKVVAFFDRDQVAHLICSDLIHIICDLIADDLCNFCLTAGNAVCVREFFE